MRVVLQVVKKADVSINRQLYSKINKGILILVGFTNSDSEDTVKMVASKISKLRIFMDSNGKTNLSLKEINGEILSVSQFTLYGNILKGNRPSFIEALNPTDAKRFYDIFNEELFNLGFIVKTGIFGKDMDVSLINDGPFTLVIDSEDFKK